MLLTGCGSVVVDRSPSATPPYDGPLDAGAAIGALECDGKTPYPPDGYAVEREGDGRVLFSYDVDGRTKVSMFAADGIRDWNGDEGWGIRAWAQCDPSELPPEVTDDLNIGVWQDESGRRVPVTRIQSFQGSEHCSWTDITFMLVGREHQADWYVRDTDGGDFSQLLRTTFTGDAALPEGVIDTGLRRDGRQLWIGPDEEAAYLVSLDDAEDVERWPAAKERSWMLTRSHARGQPQSLVVAVDHDGRAEQPRRRAP